GGSICLSIKSAYEKSHILCVRIGLVKNKKSMWLISWRITHGEDFVFTIESYPKQTINSSCKV
uniref:hypothetical protein n=1 Tax=Lactobacillus jensenii TaxID=109790 RepID=UPI00286FE3D6